MVWLLLLSEVLYSPSEQNDLLLWPLGLFLPLLPGLRAGRTPHVVHQLEKRHNTKQINPHNLFFWAYILYTHLGFAWVWFLRNRAFGPNAIPAMHGGVEAWTIHTRSNLTPPFRASPQTMWPLGIRTQWSHWHWVLQILQSVANQELCSHWNMHHKTDLKCCLLGSHPPQAAQESSTSKLVLLSCQQNHLWLVTCKVNKIPFLFFFFFSEIFPVFCRHAPYLLKLL